MVGDKHLVVKNAEGNSDGSITDGWTVIGHELTKLQVSFWHNLETAKNSI